MYECVCECVVKCFEESDLKGTMLSIYTGFVKPY